LDRCGSGSRSGAGSVSAVGMDLHEAGERDLSQKKGKQASVCTEEGQGIYSVSFQTEINLEK